MSPNLEKKVRILGLLWNIYCLVFTNIQFFEIAIIILKKLINLQVLTISMHLGLIIFFWQVNSHQPPFGFGKTLILTSAGDSTAS